MKTKEFWIKASFWSAAIADFVISISILIPERSGLTEFVYPMGLTSVIAFSWGILLLIALKKPIDNRWVLLPTSLVVFLLNGVQIISSILEIVKLNIAFLALGIFMISLLIFSYIYSSEKS